MKVFSRTALASTCVTRKGEELQVVEPVSSGRSQGWNKGFCSMLPARAKPLAYDPVRALQGMPRPQAARPDRLLAMALA
jgi:hypothetical protein